MEEQSKAFKRRLGDWRYANRWLVGRGIDVGCGPDPIKAEVWPKVTEIFPYDKELGHRDAQFLPEIENDTFDFVHSSHCLEHLMDTRSSLTNWLRVVRPGGFIVCTIPEELLYESGRWPSRYNPDHKRSFTMRSMPVIPSSTNVLAALWKLPVDVEHITLLTEHFDTARVGQDQTLGDAECAIEFVVRKPHPTQLW